MWKKIAIRTMLTVFASMLLACGAFTGQKDAVAFNDKLAAANARSDQAVKTAMEKMAPAMSGNAANVAAFKKAIDDAKATVAATKAEVAGLKVPSKQSAQDFFAAEQKYLAMRERNLADLGEIAQLIEDKKNNPLGPGLKSVEIATRIEADERKELGTLTTAQQAFAKDYNIIILPK